MPGRKSPTFTEVELEFMRILWEHEDMSTEEMQNPLRLQGRDLADGSIRKILSILLEKGHLERVRQGRGFRYRARVVRAQANRRIVQDLLKRAFDGSVTGLVATLLDERELPEEELTEIKRLIAAYEKRDQQ